MDEKQIQEQIKSLQTALEQAKAQLLKQKELLEQLTEPPLAYATVVSMSITSNERFLKFTTPGTRVRIRRDSKFAYQNDGIGTVLEYNEYGWTRVKFDDTGYVNDYRIGIKDFEGGACDLEFAEIKNSETATIVFDGKFFEVLIPENLEIQPGDAITIVPETMQIVDIITAPSAGNVGYLRRVIDEKFSEVDYESSVRVVFNGQFGKSLEKGDRVVLDGSANVIIRNLGKEDERFSFTVETNITWSDVGGLHAAKQQMIEAVELPHTHPDIFRFYGKRPVKGILLYGPPGCGKTMLGKATASALAQLHSGNAKSSGFMYIKGPEILDRFVGVAEASIRQLFQRARKHKQTHGYPAVIFIDEADAIMAKRGSGISSDIERTIVPMFLTEMDGLEDSGALVILATNRSDILDPAITRDGRIDRKIKIDRPTLEGAVEIFQLNLKNVPLNNGYTRQQLAEIGSEELFASHRVLYQVRTNSNGMRSFTLRDIVNGGMIANIVDQATSIALQRDLSKKSPEGLCKDDLIQALNDVERQNRDLNHTDELAEFVHDFRDDVTHIQRLRQVAA